MSSSSSLVGQTLVSRFGRTYMRTQKLRRDATVHRRSVYLAECEDQTFVLKRVSDFTYKKCQQLNARFAGSHRLRLHIDENEDERTLIYEYFKGNLFHFMKAYDKNPPIEAAMQIMWEAGKAVEEMHNKNMMHIDLKPDNILLNWVETQLPGGAAGPPKVGKVIVSDLDSTLDLNRAWMVRPAEEFKDLRFGNIRWRAPEMQTGQGIGLFSDVFAYALIYIYALIGQVPLGEDDYDELGKHVGVRPEELVLGRTIEHFGPVTPEFLKHTADEKLVEALKELQARVVENVGEDPESRFEHWGVKDFPHLVPSLKEILSKMLKFTPAERVTMSQIIGDPSWGRRD